MKIYIYCRVSTPFQGNGLLVQAKACRSYLNNLVSSLATQEDWRKRFQSALKSSGEVIVEVVAETISGSVPFAKRPRGGELLGKLQSGDHWCVWKLDRAFRSARDCLNVLADLKKLDVSTSVCDLPNGADVSGNGIASLFVGIMASVAQWERERISERTADQKRLAKDQGRYLGGKLPWEKRLVNRRPVDDPKKILAVRRMRKWRGAGVSLRECQGRLAKTNLLISLDAITRLTDDVASAEGKRRGRRKRPVKA